jgi:hypothetical protein
MLRSSLGASGQTSSLNPLKLGFEGSVTRPVSGAFVVCTRSAQGNEDKITMGSRRATLYY